MGVPYWDSGIVNGQVVDFGEGPTYATSPWDTLTLGGMKLPGVCAVTCQPQREVDKKKPHGGDGAKVTIRGYLPSEVMINLTIWTGEQWKIWQQIAQKLWPRAGKPAADPFDIVHPETALWGIKSVIVISPSSSKKGTVDGQRVWAIKCLEQFEPTKKSTTKTMKGSKVELHPVFKDEQGEKNAAGEPPSKTSTGPRGAKPKPHGGTT